MRARPRFKTQRAWCCGIPLVRPSEARGGNRSFGLMFDDSESTQIHTRTTAPTPTKEHRDGNRDR